MLVGQSAQGRLLQVIYTDAYSEDGALLYRVITAFDAGEQWCNEYKKAR